jgi:hypothetical protein
MQEPSTPRQREWISRDRRGEMDRSNREVERPATCGLLERFTANLLCE